MENVKKIEITVEGEEWTKTIDKAFDKKKKDLEATKRFKEKYFEYYDDIKTHTVSKYDW